MKFLEFDNYKEKKGIYIITNKTNSQVYVGQTRQAFKKRYWHHRWKLINDTHDNIHLQNSWNMYGEDNFEFSIEETVENNDNLNELEESIISKYKDLNRCYNIQSGGQTYIGYERTAEIRESIGKKNRLHMLGKKTFR